MLDYLRKSLSPLTVATSRACSLLDEEMLPLEGVGVFHDGWVRLGLP